MKNYITTAVNGIINDNRKTLVKFKENMDTDFGRFFILHSHTVYLADRENQILQELLNNLEEDGYTAESIKETLEAGIREFSHQLIEVSPFKNSTNKMANIAYMMDREVYQHLHSLYQSLKRSIDKMGAKTGLSQ